MNPSKQQNCKVSHERSKCIGCKTCAKMAPENFKINLDGKADLVKEEGDCELLTEVVQSCPVNCIHVKV